MVVYTYSRIIQYGKDDFMKQSERKGGRGGLCRPMGEYHGMSRTKIYKCWTDMVSRCVKENTKAYQSCGAKGTKMYQPWANDFMEFYKWAMDNGFREGDSVLRKDVSGNYTPDNCHVVGFKKPREKPTSEPTVIRASKPTSNKNRVVQHKLKVSKQKEEKKPKQNRVVQGQYKYTVRTAYPNRHPLYSTWLGIKSRCYNPNDSHYRWYGAKGVKICDEWLNDFQAFYDWAIANGWEKGLTIDRKDNNKSYSPCNCQFITKSQNSLKRNYQLFFKEDGSFDQERYNQYIQNIKDGQRKALKN